jgi:hypothetical protein
MFIVGMDTAVSCGCRIIHEVAVDAVTFGSTAAAFLLTAPATTQPIHFMLNRTDLEKLIGHFEAIRDEVDASIAAAGNIIQLPRERKPACAQ